MRILILVAIAALLGCASVGADTPRQKTAVVVNVTLGAPFYVASYISGYALNVLTYGTAWIWGEPEKNEDIPLWFSSDFGPNYASMNTPWCWFYTGMEPGSRALLLDWIAGNHVSSKMGIRSLKHE